ncbi:MAG: RNA polymerase sigma factor [Verrucomicrobiales bacterium]
MNADKPHAPFVETRWSLVRQLEPAHPEAERALATLCQLYWPPLYAYARHRGKSPEDAEDLVQSFFLQVLRKNHFARADAAKGRMRNFLLTLFKRHLSGEFRKANTQKRASGQAPLSLDDEESWLEDQLPSHHNPEALYDRRWAETLLRATLEELASTYAAKGQSARFAVLKAFLDHAAQLPDHETSADALGLSKSSFQVALHRFREQYRAILHRHIADTLPENKPSEIKAELLHLIAALRDEGE